ncbi:hypothetical protein AD998_02030 [bacterium 336/3]|nr:hypothetical protein AD998_02030 [bacterium 336/3]
MAEEKDTGKTTPETKNPSEENKTVDTKTTKKDTGKTTVSKSNKVTGLYSEEELGEIVKGLFDDNKKLKVLLVTEDGQAFFESNLQYAKRHAQTKRLKLYKIDRNLEVEEFSEPENND